MFRILPLAIALTATALIAGCGGGGGGSSAPGSGGGGGSVSLNGNFSGKGTENDNSDALSINIGVASDGTLCGTITDTTVKTKATLGGLVTDAGTITEGSIQDFDTKGNTLGSIGTLTGNITGIGTSQPLQISLVATEGSQVIKYAFSNVENVSSQVARVAAIRKQKRMARKAAVQKRAAGTGIVQ